MNSFLIINEFDVLQALEIFFMPDERQTAKCQPKNLFQRIFFSMCEMMC
jgi:hypothetical protein